MALQSLYSQLFYYAASAQKIKMASGRVNAEDRVKKDNTEGMNGRGCTD